MLVEQKNSLLKSQLSLSGEITACSAVPRFIRRQDVFSLLMPSVGAIMEFTEFASNPLLQYIEI